MAVPELFGPQRSARRIIGPAQGESIGERRCFSQAARRWGDLPQPNMAAPGQAAQDGPAPGLAQAGASLSPPLAGEAINDNCCSSSAAPQDGQVGCSPERTRVWKDSPHFLH
jgi:hypothetical protein